MNKVMNAENRFASGDGWLYDRERNVLFESIEKENDSDER